MADIDEQSRNSNLSYFSLLPFHQVYNLEEQNYRYTTAGLSSELPSRNTLDHLPSLFDLDVFKLNASFDNDFNPDQNLHNNIAKHDCRYFSPHSFDLQVAKITNKKTALSFLHNNVRACLYGSRAGPLSETAR